MRCVSRQWSACALAMVVAAAGLHGRVASAAPTPWSQPAGSAAEYAWSDGQDAEGWFGDAAVDTAAHTFSFEPDAFYAVGTFSLPPIGILHDGPVLSPNGTSDTISFRLHLAPGQYLRGVHADLGGSYGFLLGMVTADATLTVKNLDTNATYTRDLSFTDAGFYPGGGFGGPMMLGTGGLGGGGDELWGDDGFDGMPLSDWAITGGVMPVGGPGANYLITLDADLQAMALGFAGIGIDGARLTLDVGPTPSAVPVPAAALLFAPAAVVAAWASRRVRRA